MSFARQSMMMLLMLATAFGCNRGSAPPDSVQKPSDTALPEVDPALIQYHQTVAIPTGLHEVRAIAVAPDGRLYVAGDKVIRVLSPDGKRQQDIPAQGVQCLAVGGADHRWPGRIYAATRDHVEVFAPEGKPLGTWKSLGDQALLTGLATAEDNVFAADAGNRVVWHYDADGKLKGRIGEHDAARKIPGLLVTSPYLDLVVGSDDLLYVVNPRRLRIEAYTFDGDLESSWGHGSTEIDGFFGCCNPAHLAILPDGRFVTAEKGVPRIKRYGRDGKFECVVAGPRQLGVVAADVATDRAGHILAIDPSSSSIRIFQHNAAKPGAKP